MGHSRRNLALVSSLLVHPQRNAFRHAHPPPTPAPHRPFLPAHSRLSGLRACSGAILTLAMTGDGGGRPHPQMTTTRGQAATSDDQR